MASMGEVVQSRTINIDPAIPIEGFMEIPELEYLARTASRSSRIVEIGSWKGRSAIAMAANTLGLVYCVDTWSGHLEASEHFSQECFRDFLRNTKPFTNIMPVPHESTHAAAIFSRFRFRFDMIFVDGRHDAEGVERDLAAWMPLLSIGGILCGHDYGRWDWPDVATVVDRMIPNFRIVRDTTIWTTRKT